MLEKFVVAICQSEVDTGSPLGAIIQGPNRLCTLPAGLPPWKPKELAGQRDDYYMPNGRRPTVSCKQVTARDRRMSFAHAVLNASQEMQSLCSTSAHALSFSGCGILLQSLYVWLLGFVSRVVPNHGWPKQLANDSLLASCMQVLSIQLNQICAMNQLRNRVSRSCLLGCVGEINAGKTSLVRAQLSLPQEPDGHKPENATRCAAASPMPVPGSEGLQTTQASPLLVDTPGMFDADSTLADCAVRYLGNCHQQCTCFSSAAMFGTGPAWDQRCLNCPATTYSK